jgi:hypothetical protein
MKMLFAAVHESAFGSTKQTYRDALLFCLLRGQSGHRLFCCGARVRSWRHLANMSSGRAHVRFGGKAGPTRHSGATAASGTIDQPLYVEAGQFQVHVVPNCLRKP